MGTEEGSNSDSAESFCPTDEEIEKWMDSAFNMVGKGCNNESDLQSKVIILHKTHRIIGAPQYVLNS